MINKAKHLIMLMGMMLFLSTLSSCVHNGGDIGIWFGTWHVESISIDNAPLASYEGNVFFQFQSKIVRMTVEEKYGNFGDSYGNWEEQNNQLVIKFNDPNLPPKDVPGIDVENRFSIVSRSSSTLTLTSTDKEGHNYSYKLRKTI